ncbi:MAG: hypothetical protein JNK16_00970 [Phycisphaerales bacterium]|nr:hypothetical protein [Phycisphaerales bacterium]
MREAKLKVWLAGGAIGAAMWIGGCGSSGGVGGDAKAQANKPSDVNAGLNALSRGEQPTQEELQRFIEQSAVDMEELKQAQLERQRRLAQAKLAQADLPETPAAPEPEVAATSKEEPAAVTPPSLALNAESRKADATTQDRVKALAAELRKAIAEKADDPEGAMPRYLALAMLEMLSASEQGINVDSLALPSLDKLTDKEKQAVNSVRELLEALARDPGAAGDPQKVAELFARSMDALSGAQNVRIARAELCSKVEAFGRFKPFEGTQFLAGQSNRVIVYTEVDKYAYRDLLGDASSVSAGGSGDRWSVELSQELRLYNADGSMLAWRRPEETVIEKSRNKRRDFFITQMIELPRTLTVGPYSMKVIVRDRVGGGVSETVIPISIVADRTLVNAGEGKVQ